MKTNHLITVAALALASVFGATQAQAEPMSRQDIRGAVNELADAMARSYVFPEVGAQYRTHLRARARAGAYDSYTHENALADALTEDMNRVHRDAHLHVIVNQPAEGEEAPPRGPPPASEAFRDERWLGDGVAYLRLGGFPGDEEAVQRMGEILDRFESADVLILDARSCPGGSTEAMDVLFSRLYAQPTRLLNMDMRTQAAAEVSDILSHTPLTLRRETAPNGVTRFVHWAVPTNPVSHLAQARVFLLTDRSASACEHLALALQSTGRATLVGATTRGAGHFGGEVSFGHDRFAVWLPVGRTYVAATNWDWEGVGITPDQAVAADDALNVVLAQLGVAQSAASAEVATAPAPRRHVDASAPDQPRYGIGLARPRGGEAYLEVMEVADGGVAAQSGLRAGDRIVSLNGAPVSQLGVAQVGEAMRAPRLALGIERNGQPMTFALALPQASSSTSQ